VLCGFAFLQSAGSWLAERVAVVGFGNGIEGTDGQSVDAAPDVVNFTRGQLAGVLATQYSVVSVHGLSFLSWLVPLEAAVLCVVWRSYSQAGTQKHPSLVHLKTNPGWQVMENPPGLLGVEGVVMIKPPVMSSVSAGVNWRTLWGSDTRF
jgi:hypothetical protein